MNYELYKKLKNAGFLFKECDVEICTDRVDSEVFNGKNYHYPTLSELIEACGNYFSSFQLNHGETRDKKWQAYGTGHWCYGSTPEEAVANLYLELNIK